MAITNPKVQPENNGPIGALSLCRYQVLESNSAPKPGVLDMRLLRTVLTVSALLILAGAVNAQSRPNFSGRWVGVAPEDNAGERIDVTHTDTSLTEAHGNEHSITHKLDGTTSRNTFPSHDTEIVMVSTAQWVGKTLVVKITTTYSAGNKVETRQIWSLDADNRLNIEFTNHMNSPTEQVIKLVYKKS